MLNNMNTNVINDTNIITALHVTPADINTLFNLHTNVSVTQIPEHYKKVSLSTKKLENHISKLSTTLTHCNRG